MLEAVAAPSRGNELLLHAIEIESNGAMQQHVEILERYRQRMCANDRRERRVRRRYVAGESNPP